MPKWEPLPAEPLLFQPRQRDFWEARRKRICRPCQLEFRSIPESPTCPQCAGKGERTFDRLTIIAGRRWGKTLAGSIASVEEACIPNSIGWACAPTIPKLHRYVIPAFQQLIPPDWVANWNSEFKDLRLKNGALIHFQTLEHPDQGRGQGLDWLWIDEVCELTQMHWDVIRPSLAGPGVAFFTTTPRGYDWVYEELYKPAEDEITGYWACHAPTSSTVNPKITGEFLDREKLTLSPELYRQEYEADFVTFQGAVYGDLIKPVVLPKGDSRIAIILPEFAKEGRIDTDRQVLCGIDTGADHPFGGVKLVSTEYGMVVCGEYLERHMSFAEHASGLKRMAANGNAKWAINRNERQPRIELAQPQHGIVAIPAENDQMAGIERVKTWLHNHQLWFIEELCPKTVQQMNALRWSENTSPKTGEKHEMERVYKKNDELPDCIRYALMTWPQLPVRNDPVDINKDIRHLPLERQHTMERMRRIDKAMMDDVEPKDHVEDFWA